MRPNAASSRCTKYSWTLYKRHEYFPFAVRYCGRPLWVFSSDNDIETKKRALHAASGNQHTHAAHAQALAMTKKRYVYLEIYQCENDQGPVRVSLYAQFDSYRCYNCYYAIIAIRKPTGPTHTWTSDSNTESSMRRLRVSGNIGIKQPPNSRVIRFGFKWRCTHRYKPEWEISLNCLSGRLFRLANFRRVNAVYQLRLCISIRTFI